MIVSVWADGGTSPEGPLTVPLTVTCLSGLSTVSSTAVIVTVPVLCVSPAAIARSRFVLSAKSLATAGEAADAEILTVTGSLAGGLRVAVTVLTPPSSPIRAGVSTSVTAGAPSSSMIFSIRGSGANTLPSVTVPVTSTVWFGSSRVSSKAIIVTVPTLESSPTSIVSSRFSLSMKPSPGTAARGKVEGAARRPARSARTGRRTEKP